MPGHLQAEIKILQKRLDVALDLGLLSYERLGMLLVQSLKDTANDHKNWPRMPQPFADSVRKRFMGLVVNDIRNRRGDNGGLGALNNRMARELIRQGVTPEMYAALAETENVDAAS